MRVNGPYFYIRRPKYWVTLSNWKQSNYSTYLQRVLKVTEFQKWTVTQKPLQKKSSFTNCNELKLLLITTIGLKKCKFNPSQKSAKNNSKSVKALEFYSLKSRNDSFGFHGCWGTNLPVVPSEVEQIFLKFDVIAKRQNLIHLPTTTWF